MKRNLRRGLPLTVALALAGSALAGGSGAALAGKPAPQISGGYVGFCHDSGDDTEYRTPVNLSGKGRWGFVTVTIRVTGEPAQDFYVDPPLKVRLAPERDIVVSVPGEPRQAAMTVTVTDRKGVPVVPDESVTTPGFCP